MMCVYRFVNSLEYLLFDRLYLLYRSYNSILLVNVSMGSLLAHLGGLCGWTKGAVERSKSVMGHTDTDK